LVSVHGNLLLQVLFPIKYTRNLLGSLSSNWHQRSRNGRKLVWLINKGRQAVTVTKKLDKKVVGFINLTPIITFIAK
jgi:hypothetical protein